jgi:hypothetical protein
VLTVFTNSVSYQFAATSGYSYIANVYPAGGGIPVATQIIAVPGVLVFNTIAGLASDIDYEFELVVVNGEGAETPCPRQAFTTLAESCIPPINATAILTI